MGVKVDVCDGEGTSESACHACSRALDERWVRVSFRASFGPPLTFRFHKACVAELCFAHDHTLNPTRLLALYDGGQTRFQEAIVRDVTVALEPLFMADAS